MTLPIVNSSLWNSDERFLKEALSKPFAWDRTKSAFFVWKTQREEDFADFLFFLKSFLKNIFLWFSPPGRIPLHPVREFFVGLYLPNSLLKSSNSANNNPNISLPVCCSAVQ
jgi:hypothetical protein